MSYHQENFNCPNTFKRLATFWPILVTAGAVIVSAASASQRLDTLQDRVSYIEVNGPPPLQVRLARIEEKQNQIEARQAEMNETLGRIDDKLEVRVEERVIDGRYTVPLSKKCGRFDRNCKVKRR